MAALDVVYERLKSVDLYKFCLQIHSRKANKKDILNQLKDAHLFNTDKSPSTKYLDDLIAYKDKLNTYSKIIHKEIPQIGKSYYWLIGQLNSLKDIKLLENNFDEEFDNLNHNKFNEIIDVLETLKERIEQIGLSNHT